MSPWEVAEWPIPDAAALWYAAVRNDVRKRLDRISDRVATNEIAAEIKHYDERGRLIRGGGKSDPVGFKEHVKRLYRILGISEDEATREVPKKPKEEVAKEMEQFFVRALMGGGG